jgi:hypothetical protein
MKLASRKSRNVLTYGTWHLTHGTCPCSGEFSLVSLDGSQRKNIKAQIFQNLKSFSSKTEPGCNAPDEKIFFC